TPTSSPPSRSTRPPPGPLRRRASRRGRERGRIRGGIAGLAPAVGRFSGSRSPPMSILVGPETRVLVQGVTGREGEFHTRQSVEFGTNVVAGVTPGKGGTTAVDGQVPVFDSVVQAVDQTGANASVIYVPAAFAPDAIAEAADAGIPLVVCITEGIPTLEMLK